MGLIATLVQGIRPEIRLSQFIVNHPHKRPASSACVPLQVIAIKPLLFDNERRLAFGKIAKSCAAGLVRHTQRNLCLIAGHPVGAIANAAEHFRAKPVDLWLNAFSGIAAGCRAVVW